MNGNRSIDNTLHLIAHVRARANALLVRELEAHSITGLKPSHGDIMVMLFRHETLTMSEIAQRIHRDPSTVTTLVKKLAARGYVQTHPNPKDRRSQNVSLTEKGRNQRHVYVQLSEQLYDVTYRGISAKERASFRQTLEKILDNFAEAIAND